MESLVIPLFSDLRDSPDWLQKCLQCCPDSKNWCFWDYPAFQSDRCQFYFHPADQAFRWSTDSWWKYWYVDSAVWILSDRAEAQICRVWNWHRSAGDRHQDRWSVLICLPQVSVFQRLPLHVHKVTGPRPSVQRRGNCGKTVCILNFLPVSEWICWWQAGWCRVLWLPWKYFRHWQPYKNPVRR